MSYLIFYRHLCPVNKNLLNWCIFITLSIVWGSSFILIKIGLKNNLGAYQVAAIRIVSAGLVLLPVSIKAITFIPRKKLLIVFLSGALGSLFPSFLFCMAEEGIDSSLAGTINCLTPIFVVVTGAVFFNSRPSTNKITGIIVAILGSFLLLLSKGQIQENRHLILVSLVILATLFYGFNINMVSHTLNDISSLHITSVALTFNAIPAFIILVFTGFFKLPLLNNHSLMVATVAASVLGIAGTAIATVIFYALVKRAGAIFASMVTYAIPVVAIGWGVLFEEDFGVKQAGCLILILLGVYWANKKKDPVYSDAEVKGLVNE